MPKAVYLKITGARHCGKVNFIKYVKITKNNVLAVDVTRTKISTLRTLHSLPYNLEPATAKDFNKARTKVLKELKV